MSAEQLEGRETGPRSDIWSLGVLLYEMASGTRPFRGENLYRLCTAIIEEPMPPLPERVPAGLAAVIKRCLQKEPPRRYQRASELRAALEALEISGTAVPAPAPVKEAEVACKPVVWVSRGFAARAEFGINLGLVVSVQHSAGQERVNYSLVDASSHQQLRAGTITAPRGDPFALQDQVSESVTQALELELQPQEKRALQAHGTTEPAAYDFYLQGRGYLQDYVKPENVENAIKVFNSALKKDPAFAAANAGLGEAYWRKYRSTHDNQWANAAVENCQRGAERDAGLAAAHFCLGLAFGGTGRYHKALDEYRRGRASDPRTDTAHGGLAYR